ncbi:MAG: glycoside hydrolase family 27 protein [Roseburia sp.]
MNKNDCAKTPPMGWNSYDYYDTTVNEMQVRANAEYMAEHLKEYGWEYIVVDIQWYAHGAGSMRDKYQYIPFSKLEMDEYSRLLPDPNRFPSSVGGAGFKPLANYIHSLGLKFGIHIMRGIPRIAAHQHTAVKGCNVTADEIALPDSICWWNPDMYGVTDTPEGQAYYDSIFELYAQWGVDFVKCDDICRMDQPSARYEIEMIAKAIEKSGRPMVLSLSPGPAKIDWSWHYETYANMWRITDDFWDNWNLLKDMFHRCEIWQRHVSEGCYPDCDMLPLGCLGKGFGEERITRFSKYEQKTMLTMWCLFGSPLMLGCEMTKLDDFTLSLLTNKEVLEMLTPKCVPHQVCLDDEKAIWTAHNEETGKSYLALYNLSDDTAKVSVSIDSLRMDNAPDSLTELWTKEVVTPDASGIISAELFVHDCVVYGW